MLDEIEYITPSLSGALGQHWDRDFIPFWQTIRATHQENKGNLVFIVAGVNPASVEETRFGDLPNPIFQLALPTYLEPFERENVRKMVRTLGRYAGVKFKEEVYDYLTAVFGGHPFLIRIACSEIYKSVNRNDPKNILELNQKNFADSRGPVRDRLSQPIKDILLSLVWWYPDEYTLLQMLAEGENKFVDEYIKDGSGSLLKFVKYGLLKSEEETTFAIDDLRDFLIKFGEAYKKEISPFTRGDMPPELLPAIPNLEELGRLFSLRVEIETKFRKAILFYLGVHRSWNDRQIAADIVKGLRKRPDRKDPSALFVGQKPREVMPELYLLDLKEIILANWEVFKGLFENKKSRFEMNMDTINLARRVEAHTKPLSLSDITDFKNSYGWMKRHLSKIPE
jgi:hypothetical protein